MNDTDTLSVHNEPPVVGVASSRTQRGADRCTAHALADRATGERPGERAPGRRTPARANDPETIARASDVAARWRERGWGR